MGSIGNMFLYIAISLTLLLSSCGKSIEGGRTVPISIANLTHDLSDGKIAKMVIFGRSPYSTTTIPMRPETFHNIPLQQCATIKDSNLLKQLSSAVAGSNYNNTGANWDIYWHILFFDYSNKIAHDLYMGMKYSNYDFVYLRLDGQAFEGDGTLESWLYRNVNFQPCSRQSR